MEDLGSVEVSVASPGFGASINSMPDFNNVKDMYPLYSVPHGLHRRSDPGAGAFTYYHSRKAKALSTINPGDEMFVSYDDSWFVERKKVLGPVPLEGDHAQADSLYRKLKRIVKKESRNQASAGTKRGFMLRSDVSGVKAAEQNRIVPPAPVIDPSTQQQQQPKQQVDTAPLPTPHISEKIAEELWDNFLLGSPWDDSPTMAALPSTKEEFEAMDTQPLEEVKKHRLNRSLMWLQENGVCGDTMHTGLSTIRQAGHGAFASWHLQQGTVVLPVPLIHIPDRAVLDFYYSESPPDSTGKRRGKDGRVIPPQLLLNYCMGHRDSTLLLSPYGPLFSLINHNKTLANVKLQWASPLRSQHNPRLLNRTVSELSEIRRAQLAMELVALRDIEPGEEIFLDYGDEWEAAWQKHVQEWKPVEGANTYISAFEMNQQLQVDDLLRTESEQQEFPYPPNLMLKFHYFFFDTVKRRFWVKSNPIPLTKPIQDWQERYSAQCKIIRRYQQGRRTLYGIMVPSQDPPHEWITLENIPREALFFQDRAYTTDMFLENVFRHDLRIPDDMFPEMWKNAQAK